MNGKAGMVYVKERDSNKAGSRGQEECLATAGGIKFGCLCTP
jgi:hypothetical protein